ncbi:MAG: hypothetical protein NVSMB3_12600 [Acidobacteriaceae bacterium]
MASAHKKVLVRRFLGDVLPGYLPMSAFVRHGAIGLLDLQGRISSMAVSDIKHISYVRDFNLGDTVNPERLTRRAFLARPRAEGLWVRVTFRSPGSTSLDPRSPDMLEGLASPDISLFDDLLDDLGLYLTPPDTRSNTQRVFIPRSSLEHLQILAVITTPSRSKAAPPPSPTLQDELFNTPLPSDARPN